MWFDAEIADGDDDNNIEDGSDCDSGVNDNISDINTVSDIEDNVEPIDMDVINYNNNNNNNNNNNINILQQQQLQLLEYHQPHLLHPIIEADDETASNDSGADFSENNKHELDILEDIIVNNINDEEEDLEDNELDEIDAIIADPILTVAGIANDWIPFDDKKDICNITYKILPFSSEYSNTFTNKLEYMLHVVIPKLRQHADADIFEKLKPQRIHSDFKGPLERSLSFEIIEQRILHCYYSNYDQCLNDFEALFFFDTFPKAFYDYGHKNSIGTFFHKLLHRLPHEEKELPPPILSHYKCSTTTTSTTLNLCCGRRKRKLSFSTTAMDDEDDVISKKRALIISTNDLLNRFKTFSPSSN